MKFKGIPMIYGNATGKGVPLMKWFSCFNLLSAFWTYSALRASKVIFFYVSILNMRTVFLRWEWMLVLHLIDIVIFQVNCNSPSHSTPHTLNWPFIQFSDTNWKNKYTKCNSDHRFTRINVNQRLMTRDQAIKARLWHYITIDNFTKFHHFNNVWNQSLHNHELCEKIHICRY